MRKSILAFLALSMVLLMVSCPTESGEEGGWLAPMPSKAIDFGGAASKTIDLSEHSPGKKIYLVTVNTGAYSVSGGNIGGAAPSVYGEFSGSETGLPDPSGSLLDGGAVPPGHHPGAVAFNANPPPITQDMLQNRASSFSASVVPYTVGSSTKNFWVQKNIEQDPDTSSNWVQNSATLRAQGPHCNIWVMEGIQNGMVMASVNAGMAQALSEKFEQIYPLETKALGYEYGGNGAGGGVDRDGRVQILVYDFYPGASVSSGVAGFFWGKDFYADGTLAPLRSNLAEILYINAQFLNTSPNMIYSTLAHEFQHMINFNVKTIQRGKNSDSWYNEMLSMMAEDMISPLIGIAPTNTGHPTPSRINGFLTTYADEGVERWQAGANVLDSYAYKYAFGAYLARNYGGAELLKNILANNSTNIDSVVAAVKQTTGNARIDFNYLLEKFAEAFIYSNTTDGATFNQNVIQTISGTNYTFAGFDIWNNYNITAPTVGCYAWTGPTVYALTSHPAMQPYSVYVQSAAGWETGTLTSVTLNRPASSNVKLYLMMR